MDLRAPDYPRDPLPYVVCPASSAALQPACMGCQRQRIWACSRRRRPAAPPLAECGGIWRLALQASEREDCANLHPACAMGHRRTLLWQCTISSTPRQWIPRLTPGGRPWRLRRATSKTGRCTASSSVRCCAGSSLQRALWRRRARPFCSTSPLPRSLAPMQPASRGAGAQCSTAAQHTTGALVPPPAPASHALAQAAGRPRSKASACTFTTGLPGPWISLSTRAQCWCWKPSWGCSWRLLAVRPGGAWEGVVWGALCSLEGRAACGQLVLVEASASPCMGC